MQSLGIDIGDSRITGVVLEQRHRQLAMVGCFSLPTPYRADPAEAIDRLCRELGWKEGVCVCGLSLSLLSVRNLNLPFADAKKITQVLPFELEEQLLAPVETVVTDFSFAGKGEAGAAVVSFSLEKSWLQDLLTGLHEVVDPAVVTPAMASLALHLARQDKGRPNFLLVHVDLHASSLVLVANGQPALFRRLAYSEEMILSPPFHCEQGQVEIVDPEAATECIRQLCRSIEQSLDYFRMENKEGSRGGGLDLGLPERIVLTGPLSQGTFVSEVIWADFELPVECIDLLAANGIACTQEVREQWLGPFGDRALALALQGFKRTGVNFRKDGFAPRRQLFSSRKQLLGAVAAAAALVVGTGGYLGYDYHRLQQRDADLMAAMVTLYKQTFPGVTKVHDPLAEMQAKMKAAQGPASPALFAHGEKRVLGLLADISARIPEAISLRVNRLNIDRESVTLKGTTDTFNAVQAIKSALAASAKFKSVQIVSATADKDKKKGAVRFEVQLQLEGL
ncbi:MAG: PilN domain-containing protein [Desulfobulbus sp.]|jgi:general secretion pathway protein L|uniref:type II secretion system protein GspL n=1 Tax=Desulfobulbus sp. TaxID=895 RepID=UPI0028407648|nr:type II secretion system protein GspL [Desulfobulbus sp.]MDR2548856.1 PilN domain-containing protein [Desulfobulbus sp.]